MKKSFLVFVLLFLAACSDPLILREQDSGKTISVKKGTSPIILLNENPDKGYAWQFFFEPENQNILETFSPFCKPDFAILRLFALFYTNRLRYKIIIVPLHRERYTCRK